MFFFQDCLLRFVIHFEANNTIEVGEEGRDRQGAGQGRTDTDVRAGGDLEMFSPCLLLRQAENANISHSWNYLDKVPPPA